MTDSLLPWKQDYGSTLARRRQGAEGGDRTSDDRGRTTSGTRENDGGRRFVAAVVGRSPEVGTTDAHSPMRENLWRMDTDPERLARRRRGRSLSGHRGHGAGG